MEIAERAKKYFLQKDMNCAESVLRAANDEYDLLIPESYLKMAGGFGGGLCTGSACGAVCGAVMAISKIYNTERAHICPDLKRKALAFTDAFKERFGFLDCAPLKERYYSEKEKCALIVENAAEILDGVIKSQ